MENSNSARHDDTRDARTQDGEAARPAEYRAMLNEVLGAQPDDPVTAADSSASPSSYTLEEIDEGDTPRDEEIDQFIDPTFGRERMGNTNLDVLDLDPSWLVESEEPDFMDDPGTSDIIEAIEEGEPYVPPIDPPLTTRPLSNAGVRGGFSIGSDEELDDTEDEPLRVRSGDEDITDRVIRALRLDAYTTDLNIDVEVADGVAYLTGKVRSLEEVERAEEVAGSVPGVEEVEEDLEIV
ncbi:MAG: BON domain-containing protein [Chloroflexia bacterium]